MTPAKAAGILVSLFAQAGLALAQQEAAPPDQWEAYAAPRAKTIIELQPFRSAQTVALPSGEVVTLINLNPTTNATFLLQSGGESYHIDNPAPRSRQVTLAEDATLRIEDADGSLNCPLRRPEADLLRAARDSGLPFAPFCKGRLHLRNAVSGSRSNLERVTDFLRDNIWGGEEIVGFVRDSFYRDQYAAFPELRQGEAGECVETGPCAAAIDPRHANSLIAPIGFGIALMDPEQKAMAPGAWYAAAGFEDVFVSAIQPRTIAQDILSQPGPVNALDSIEGKAVAYLIAFDLDRYGLGFALGTDHPRLDWSPRPAAAARIRGLPGPDGVASAVPLVRSGMVGPQYAARTIATFTGGFKRSHGAFKYGDYAGIDTGKHYGFIERGVIYSKLKTGLSTIYVLDDGSVDMKLWTEADDALLPRVMYARQNGVPLVETDPATGQPVPGDRVNKWGPGNWSGSAEGDLRSLRAGACLQHWQGRRYLIYAYFSTATPSAMARTFQAYGCSHAMLLDMNALEHTYLALYPRLQGQVLVEHLITGMAQLDKSGAGGGVIPRFLGYPDSRDLFFVHDREMSR